MILVGAAAFLLSIGVLFNRLESRPSLFNRPGTIGPLSAKKKVPFSESKLFQPVVALFRPWANMPYFKKLRSRCEVFKIRQDMSLLLLQKLVLGIVAALVLYVSFYNMLYAVGGLLLGFFVPDMILLNRVKAKKEAIIMIFPETVDLLDMCISAGADFLTSVKWLIEKSDTDPFIEQLEMVLNETKMGKTRTEALKDMARRLESMDINTFVRTIVQAERMGTPLEETFRNISEDTRDRRFQNGERYAIKASLKILFPLLFCILPAIMIVVAGPIMLKFMEGSLIPKM